MPAGCVQLSTFQMICYKHINLKKEAAKKRKKKKTYSHHFNVNYCAACSIGGDLICCERCPMSVHCDCVGLDGAPEGSYFCPDCTSGKSVLFGDIVWVKMGQHRFEIHIGIRLIDIGFYRFVSRWWPGRVLPPDEVPPVHLNRQLKPGEFVVYFYGCKQTAIVYRGQAFHYEDGVSSNQTVFFESSHPNPICLLQDEGTKVSGNGTLRQGFDLAMVDVTLPFQQRQLVLAERKLERQKKINLVTINNFL